MDVKNKMFNWIYHGKNRKQCYYEPNCLVCYTKLTLKLIKQSVELKKANKKLKNRITSVSTTSTGTAYSYLQNSLYSYLQLLTVANYLPNRSHYKTTPKQHQNNQRRTSK